MSTTPEAFVQITIRSDSLTGEQIAARLHELGGVYWERGDRRPTNRGLGGVEKRNGWMLESSLPHDTPLLEQVEAMLTQVDACQANIKELSDSCDVQFSCIVYSTAIPSLYFDKHLIDGVARIGAHFDIDLYLIE